MSNNKIRDKSLVTVAGALAIATVTILAICLPLYVRGPVVGITGFCLAVGWWWTRGRRSRSVGFSAGEWSFSGHMVNSPHDEETTHRMLLWLAAAAGEMLETGGVSAKVAREFASPASSRPDPSGEAAPREQVSPPAIAPPPSEDRHSSETPRTPDPSRGGLGLCGYCQRNEAVVRIDANPDAADGQPTPSCEECAERAGWLIEDPSSEPASEDAASVA